MSSTRSQNMAETRIGSVVISMAKVDDVIKVAEGELGYYAPSDPEAGSKYGRWLADLWGEEWLRGPSTDIWWCCLYVSWVLDHAGQLCPGFPTYNTDLAVAHGAGDLCVATESIRRGDILIFDWNWNTAATDHIGIAIADASDGRVDTIEGNVSNAVAHMSRSLGTIRYAIRPPYDSSDTTAPQQPSQPEPQRETVDVDGYLGPISISAWQKQLGTPADGVVSGQYRGNSRYLNRLLSVSWGASGSTMVRAIQRKLGGLQVDGILGPASVSAIQKYVGAYQDGYLGPDTAAAIQRSLNEGRWA